MKFVTTIVLAVLLAVFSTSDLQARQGGRGKCQGKGHGGRSCSTTIADLPTEDLNEAEKASLLKMREEEKLARDVYLTLGEKWDAKVFRNIPEAEQRHMDSVASLLERYELDDPVTDDTVGAFASEEFAKLYQELVTKGSLSLADALTVGATIEDLDIFDLNEALAGDVDNLDIRQVYDNLVRGSRNHMRAFAGSLEGEGKSYTPQYLSGEELAAILDSDWERGQGGKGGRGKGKGNGKGNCKGHGQGRGKCGD
ncbi:MAG: DUF2202 domain-containing protein [Candidatus Krumholzibacteriota bacterium]